MATLKTPNDAMKEAREIRIRVVEGMNAELSNFSHIREEQIKLSQDERSKINFLAFAIVGSVLGFSPDSLHNPLVVVGLGIILLNAFLFGFVADTIQRNLNIGNAEGGINDAKKIVEPYFDAYDEMGKHLDDPALTLESAQEKYSKMEDAYITYLDEHKKKNVKPRLAARTKLAIGYWYFALFAAGLIILGAGLVMQHGTSQVSDRNWHQWR